MQPEKRTKLDSSVAEEIIYGLSSEQKKLPSKLFYDEKGSKLFDKICELPEYYPTRTEIKIIRDNIGEIVSVFDEETLFVELGSGSSVKTKIILEHLPKIKGYIPVDISHEHLYSSADKLREEFPQLKIIPVAADYTKEIEFPEIYLNSHKKALFFPGSTIGNFVNENARNFLSILQKELRKDGLLLIGIDLQKDIDVLERAYNDSANVTAAFNLNILNRLNYEYGFDFDVNSFRHKAVYNKVENRIEMLLISVKEQTVSGLGRIFSFHANETILTEYSHKYTIDGFLNLCKDMFHLEEYWTDENNFFAILLLKAH